MIKLSSYTLQVDNINIIIFLIQHYLYLIACKSLQIIKKLRICNLIFKITLLMHVHLLKCRKLWLLAYRLDKRWQKHGDCDRKSRRKRIQPFTQTRSGNYWRYGRENVQHGNEVCHAQTRILRLPGEREAWERNRLIYKEW